MTQNNLGEAYRTSFWGERANNLEQAIRCYEKVLQVYTYEAFPERWATTQNNLAAAYGERVCGSRAENLERAIAHFQNALQVHTRGSFPQYHAETQLNLGLAYQDTGQFPNAHTAFKIGIDTVESLRSEIISGSGNEQAKQKLAEEYNKLYQRMVEVCLELAKEEPKYSAQAIEYAERSKARNLVELLATRDLYPKGDIPEAVLNELNQQAIALNFRTLLTKRERKFRLPIASQSPSLIPTIGLLSQLQDFRKGCLRVFFLPCVVRLKSLSKLTRVRLCFSAATYW